MTASWECQRTANDRANNQSSVPRRKQMNNCWRCSALHQLILLHCSARRNSIMVTYLTRSLSDDALVLTSVISIRTDWRELAYTALFVFLSPVITYSNRSLSQGTSGWDCEGLWPHVRIWQAELPVLATWEYWTCLLALNCTRVYCIYLGHLFSKGQTASYNISHHGHDCWDLGHDVILKFKIRAVLVIIIVWIFQPTTTLFAAVPGRVTWPGPQQTDNVWG